MDKEDKLLEFATALAVGMTLGIFIMLILMSTHICGCI